MAQTERPILNLFPPLFKACRWTYPIDRLVLYTKVRYFHLPGIFLKIALSKDKVRISINILAESHMSFDLGDKIDIR